MRAVEPNAPLTKVEKRIGVKYCGGCNPGYDRVEITERVQFHFNNRLSFLRHDEPEIDLLIFISGCHRACAGQNLTASKIPSCSVTGEDDLDKLVNWLKSLDQKGDS